MADKNPLPEVRSAARGVSGMREGVFLPPAVTRRVRKFVHDGPEFRSPSFKRGAPVVVVRGAFLRYSTTTPRR